MNFFGLSVSFHAVEVTCMEPIWFGQKESVDSRQNNSLVENFNLQKLGLFVLSTVIHFISF